MSSNALPIAREKARQFPRQGALPALLPVAVAIVSSVSLLLLVQTTGLTTSGYDLKRLGQEREDWQQANYQIEADIARAQSLDRIEKEARGKLQMVPASDYIFVKVKGIPAVVPDKLSPPAHAKRIEIQREDEGWSQRLLDWLGATLGFR